ncbi:MAG: hypothetical protein JNM31_00770 [Flavobacteriales bacterium]|nr:hypothetical protein [Flavobacteriales bacterium]
MNKMRMTLMYAAVSILILSCAGRVPRCMIMQSEPGELDTVMAWGEHIAWVLPSIGRWEHDTVNSIRAVNVDSRIGISVYDISVSSRTTDERTGYQQNRVQYDKWWPKGVDYFGDTVVYLGNVCSSIGGRYGVFLKYRDDENCWKFGGRGFHFEAYQEAPEKHMLITGHGCYQSKTHLGKCKREFLEFLSSFQWISAFDHNELLSPY